MKKLIVFIFFVLLCTNLTAQTVIDLQEHIRQASEEALEYVVQINTTTSVTDRSLPFITRSRELPGVGSGIIFGKVGETVLVLTNAHVLRGTSEANIILSDGTEYNANDYFEHNNYDLAIVVFRTDDELSEAPLGNSDELNVGDFVLAIGSPLGFSGTVTFGIVSSIRLVDQQNQSYIQTDASINPGNSGGPLINLKGEVIGINTWIASRTGGNIGLGFSIPINEVKILVDDFLENFEGEL